jgi:hypothetical protein
MDKHRALKSEIATFSIFFRKYYGQRPWSSGCRPDGVVDERPVLLSPGRRVCFRRDAEIW